MPDQKKITIVIPCFNEADNIRVIVQEIGKQAFKYPYEILFVNDGSHDASPGILRQVSHEFPHVKFISFARNFGHQMALKAGIDHARGDCVITMDADMQHSPSVLPALVAQWEQGFEVVITKRSDHDEIGWWKKVSSRLFYKVLTSLSSIPLSYGESDFRLMDKKVVKVFKGMNETNLFLRGLARWVGFKVCEVHYKAEDRFAGKSKYTFKKMISLALDGILSFSTRPLYASIYVGFICACTSIFVLAYALFSYFAHRVIPGWTSTLIIMTFFSGIQLVLLGIVGLYIAKLFEQSKNRPLYIIYENNYTGDEES